MSTALNITPDRKEFLNLSLNLKNFKTFSLKRYDTGRTTQKNHKREEWEEAFTFQEELKKEEKEEADDFVVNREDRLKQFSSSRNLNLDPRDESVRVPFESEYYSRLLLNNFKGVPFGPFEDELRDWLVDVIEITTSIGYNHLNRETLTEKEVKNFVAKNILENVKRVFEEYGGLPL
jgi:hypothetical protein